MKRRSVLIVFTLLAAITLPACSRHPGGTAQPFALALTTAPTVPAANSETIFTLKVARDDHPVTGATARLALKMTFMNMGPNVVHLQEQDKGTYVGKGQFTMSGDWDCIAIVSAGGAEQQQTFHYKIG